MGNWYNETISENKILLLKQNGYWHLKLKLLSVRKSALCNIHSYRIRILQWMNRIFCQHLCRPVSCWYWLRLKCCKWPHADKIQVHWTAYSLNSILQIKETQLCCSSIIFTKKCSTLNILVGIFLFRNVCF